MESCTDNFQCMDENAECNGYRCVCRFGYSVSNSTHACSSKLSAHIHARTHTHTHAPPHTHTQTHTQTHKQKASVNQYMLRFLHYTWNAYWCMSRYSPKRHSLPRVPHTYAQISTSTTQNPIYSTYTELLFLGCDFRLKIRVFLLIVKLICYINAPLY